MNLVQRQTEPNTSGGRGGQVKGNGVYPEWRHGREAVASVLPPDLHAPPVRASCFNNCLLFCSCFPCIDHASNSLKMDYHLQKKHRRNRGHIPLPKTQNNAPCLARPPPVLIMTHIWVGTKRKKELLAIALLWGL